MTNNVTVNEKDYSKEDKIAKVKLIILRILAYSFLIANALVCLAIFYILVLYSTKLDAELDGSFTLMPSAQFLQNWWTNLSNALIHPKTVNIIAGMRNSFIIAALSSILGVYFSALTAYAVYTYDFKGRNFVAAFIIGIMMIPSQVSTAGFLSICFKLDEIVDQMIVNTGTDIWQIFSGTDNLAMFILPSIAAPATYFYMLQYLKSTLPKDLVEASRIDGSNEFMTFNRIVLPIMKPALAVQLIFAFVGSWNNLYLPNLLLKDFDKQTLPVMLNRLRSVCVAGNDAGQIWMVIFLAIFPVVIVYIFLSKFIIKGVTSGSVKG